ncbi:DUF2267 domain-containing protein [Pseudanabaena sp. FACHB-2040]|uniref:DUF2267 domain-containing protein n=1 Tax=Pseudanabaena sp. FACHB-2040 TaxID=2692859 RepID=UPI00168565D5|nr:DUF2267 domain-containing protein [Pseudanabaena sp. FACHB-2040]MBD2256595.1 DUF2267 domain-containing protein [Pseudanabaena sp. FACHB-2040]
MPIPIRDDVVYIILKKVHDCDRAPGPDPVNFTQTDFAGINLTPVDLLGHLDYLNQKQYINAEFSGNAYGNQEDVPDTANPKEFDLRIANTFGASDGPLPHLITFQKAELTEKGERMLQEMEANPPQDLKQGPQVPLPDEHMPFLEKVMVKGSIPDPYDARDIAEVVFRVMRDVMTTEEADRVESELHTEALDTDEKALRMEVADLWHDTNPIVSFLSRIRPPLRGPGWTGIGSDLFLKRVDTEASVPPTSNAKKVVTAVFSATKDELSQERIQELAEWMPQGTVRELWENA